MCGPCTGVRLAAEGSPPERKPSVAEAETKGKVRMEGEDYGMRDGAVVGFHVSA